MYDHGKDVAPERPAHPQALFRSARHEMVTRPAEDEAVLVCLTALEASLAGAGAPPDSLADFPPRTLDRKSTRLNSSHIQKSRMPSSA